MLTAPGVKNQNPSDYGQDDCDDGKSWIGFHNLFSFYDKKVNKDNYGATDNSSKKISIGNVPFNHLLPLISSNETAENSPVINNDNTNLNRKLSTSWVRVNSGEITPAANQATAILPRTSDALSNWPEVNFIHLYASTKKLNRVKMSQSNVTFNWWVIDIHE